MSDADDFPRGWDGHREMQRRRWLALTAEQRLRALDEMRRFWLLARASREASGSGSKPETPPAG